MPPVHAAEGATQQAVLGIWKELLELGDIDATANFFDIGGHSILAMRMQGMLSSTFGRRFPVSDLFRFPTIQALSAHIDASAEGGGAAAGDARGQHRAQRRLDARARQADLLQRRGRRPPPGA
jgi:acyl carrier protein